MDKDEYGNWIPYIGNLSKFGRHTNDMNLSLTNIDTNRNAIAQYPITGNQYCYRWSDETDRLTYFQILRDDFFKIGPIQEICAVPSQDFLFLWIDHTTQPRLSLILLNP